MTTIALIVAALALLVALAAVLVLVRDRRRHARQVAQLRGKVAGLRVDLTHHLNTSARWNG